MSPEFTASSHDSTERRTVEFTAGTYIFHEGELGTEMYIVQEGQVEILREQAQDRPPVAVMEKGDFFGEMSVLEELPRSATARAVTDVKLIRIDGATFESMLRANPEIGIRIMRKLSRRLRDSEGRARELDGELHAATHSATGVPEATAASVQSRLVHTESGRQFEVRSDSSLTIGREDPVTGIRPRIDLTAIDPERSSSRRHAKIVFREERFFLVEDIGATNGTFLNGTRIGTGVPVPLESGDTIRFGLVEVVFHEN